MAPKRRTASRTASATSNQQSKLSFSNKVTKRSAEEQSKKIKADPTLLEDAIPTNVEVQTEAEAAEPTSAEKAIVKQVDDEAATLDTAADPLDNTTVKTEDVLGGKAVESDAGAIGGKASGWVADEEERARKVTEAQIKSYWRAKEQQRLAPRVHQQELTVHEKVLREWDMSNQYGPCIGIARLKRWKRANLLGLEPPIEVLAVLLKGMDAGDVKGQRAHVDELMNSRFGTED